MASAAYQITVLSLAAAMCQTVSLTTKSLFPNFECIWLASWPETDVWYLTTGKILYLCILGKCHIPLPQNKWVSEAVTEMLQEGDARTVVPSSEAALHCCDCLPVVQVLTVISVTAIVRSFLNHKLRFLEHDLEWVSSAWAAELWEAGAPTAQQSRLCPLDQLMPPVTAVLPFPLRSFCRTSYATHSCAGHLWDQLSTLVSHWAILLSDVWWNVSCLRTRLSLRTVVWCSDGFSGLQDCLVNNSALGENTENKSCKLGSSLGFQNNPK